MIDIGVGGRGEIAFGAMQATLDIAYGRSSIAFEWTGIEKFCGPLARDVVRFIGDDSIEIEFDYHNGDEAVLKAKREPFSTTC